MNWKKGKGFKPIRRFTGKFDGKYHKIVNLYINRPNKDNVGLFSIIIWRDKRFRNRKCNGIW